MVVQRFDSFAVATGYVPVPCACRAYAVRIPSESVYVLRACVARVTCTYCACKCVVLFHCAVHALRVNCVHALHL